MISRNLKNSLFYAANQLGIDSLFRRLNRGKLLVVMYHGVTATVHDPPVWTQLPVEQFRWQLEFLREHYRMISLGELVDAVRNNKRLPDRTALVTFDDGLKNNFTVAFPVLQELNVPAAVYLTVDLIGSRQILWVDELYLFLREAVARKLSLDLPIGEAQEHLREGQIWKSYEIMVEALKRSGAADRTREMDRLRTFMPSGLQSSHEDFCLLDWSEVRDMHRSGLVEFGVHTATHRILSELKEEEWEREIVQPKHTLERELNAEAASFCFPNGRPGVDFRTEHLDSLRKAGYACAFTTENALYNLHGGDSMSIGRVPAGNDSTSDADYFRLNTSGAIQALRAVKK